MTDLLILVVLYNKDADTSQTLKSLSQNQHLLKSHVHITVWENSKTAYTNAALLTDLFKSIPQITYLHTPENSALSHIYNTIINENLLKYKYLALYDDDTDLNAEYLQEVVDILISPNKSYLHLPQIIANDILVSPAKYYYFIGRYIKDIKPGPVSSKFAMGINSGMLIMFDYFKKFSFRYDEELSFYGTDNDFMAQYAKNAVSYNVMRSKLYHSLSQFEKGEPVEKTAARMRQILKGMLHLNKKKPIIYILTHIYVLILSISQAIQYKNTKFVYHLWKN